MSTQTHKDINPQFISIRPMNLYKEWILTDNDFTIQPNLKKFLSASAVRDGYHGDLNTYYALYTSSVSGSIPNFPGLNAKYARLFLSETGSATGPNDDITDADGYVLSYNYELANGDKFYPTYQSQSGWMNPDGTYARMVHYSLQTLFYGRTGVYKNLFYESSSILKNEAMVIEIPQRYVGDSIEPGTFVLIDANNVNNLPYTDNGTNEFTPYDNTVALNPLASEGIKLIDDSHGNLFDANYSSSVQRGNIFYEMGLVVITDQVYAGYFRQYLITSGSII